MIEFPIIVGILGWVSTILFYALIACMLVFICLYLHYYFTKIKDYGKSVCDTR